jgi:hypothetical protein
MFFWPFAVSRFVEIRQQGVLQLPVGTSDLTCSSDCSVTFFALYVQLSGPFCALQIPVNKFEVLLI